MSVNVQNIEKTLSSLLVNVKKPEDALLYSKAISLLKTASINVVQTFSGLPVFSSVQLGSLYLVKSDSMVYVRDTNSWRPIVNDFKSAVWSWGSNTVGLLGDNTTVSKSSPVSVVGGFTDWCQVSAGWGHTSAVRLNGTLWAWGCNNSGQIGDTTTVSKTSPVSVVGGFTDWCQVSAGACQALAVRTNGTLWAWGSNYCGRLGDGTTVSKTSPVSVVGGFTDWCQVSSGGYHSAAVRTNGTLWAWGINLSGQLGDASTVAKSSPVSVVGGFTDWCQVSASASHTLAFRTNGTLWAWGSGGNGLLGNNAGTGSFSPVSVVGGFTDWCQVSAGRSHPSAVRANGTIWSWGSNGNGRLGDNTINARSSPVSVVGGFTDWCQVSAGNGHTAAVRTNGTIWVWGSNLYGRIGDNTTADKSSPVSVVGGFTDWCQVSAGYQHTVAITKKVF